MVTKRTKGYSSDSLSVSSTPHLSLWWIRHIWRPTVGATGHSACWPTVFPDFITFLSGFRYTFLASEGWNDTLCSSGFFPGRYSNEPPVWGKALSSHKSKRQSGAFSLWRCSISARATPLCWPENKWKPNLFWQKPFPAPASGAFPLAYPAYEGSYVDEQCLGAQPRRGSSVWR